MTWSGPRSGPRGHSSTKFPGYHERRSSATAWGLVSLLTCANISGPLLQLRCKQQRRRDHCSVYNFLHTSVKIPPLSLTYILDVDAIFARHCDMGLFAGLAYQPPQEPRRTCWARRRWVDDNGTTSPGSGKGLSCTCWYRLPCSAMVNVPETYRWGNRRQLALHLQLVSPILPSCCILSKICNAGDALADTKNACLPLFFFFSSRLADVKLQIAWDHRHLIHMSAPANW